MPTILLIRHGQNDFLKKKRFPGRLPGVHLNAAGKEQAEELAGDISRLPIKGIFCSPLERAVETAMPLAQRKSLPLIQEPGLIEMDIGRWAGRSIMTLQHSKDWQRVLFTPSRMTFPGGESFHQAQARIVGSLEKICSLHKKDDLIAIISHADPIKLAIAHHIGLPLDSFQHLIINPCSVTILDIQEGWARLMGMNLKPPIHTSI